MTFWMCELAILGLCGVILLAEWQLNRPARIRRVKRAERLLLGGTVLTWEDLK